VRKAYQDRVVAGKAFPRRERSGFDGEAIPPERKAAPRPRTDDPAADVSPSRLPGEGETPTR